MKLKTKIKLVVITFPLWLPFVILWIWFKDLYEHCKK